MVLKSYILFTPADRIVSMCSSLLDSSGLGIFLKLFEILFYSKIKERKRTSYRCVNVNKTSWK